MLILGTLAAFRLDVSSLRLANAEFGNGIKTRSVLEQKLCSPRYQCRRNIAFLLLKNSVSSTFGSGSFKPGIKLRQSTVIALPPSVIVSSSSISAAAGSPGGATVVTAGSFLDRLVKGVVDVVDEKGGVEMKGAGEVVL